MKLRLGLLLLASLSSAAQAQEPAEPTPWRGFRFAFPDHDAELRVRGLVQSDGVFFVHDHHDQTNRFEIRRARIALAGHVGSVFAFRIEPQFTPGSVVVLDAYVDARLAGDALVIRAGKMKSPLGIEMLQPIEALILPERGLTTGMVPTRDIGIDVHGEWHGLQYAVGVFDGALDGETPEGNVDDHVDVDARVFVEPFHDASVPALEHLGLGVAGSFGSEQGDERASGLPSYRTATRTPYARYADGTVAEGNRWRLNPQAWWYWGPVGLVGEFVHSSVRVRGNGDVQEVAHRSWMVAGSWVLTGDRASYSGVSATRPWGALELGGRYAEQRLDESAMVGAGSEPAPHRVRAWGLALSYWATAVVRAQLALERTSFELSSGDRARAPENALFLRLQASL